MLCLIYKNGSRQVLLPTLPQTHIVFGLFDTTLVSSNALLRKLLIKLCQRIGLCYMRPRVAKWRYQRGFRSLAANLAPQTLNGTGASAVAENEEGETEEEEYDDIPQVMENILDILLRGLSDRVTILYL